MFRSVIQFTGKFFWGGIVALLAVACDNDKKEASSTAKAFLQAYYVDLDFETAQHLSNDASRNAIAEQAKIIALNPYAKEETPDIVFKTLEISTENPNMASCVYTCNRTERKLPLHKLNNKWLIDLQGGTVETNGSETNFIKLSSDGNNGFASASSGEIKYKKRRKGNSTN